MRRLVLLLILAPPFLISACEIPGIGASSHRLAYHVDVEPDMGRVRISGAINGLRKGDYYFVLPRTHGRPASDFIKYVAFHGNSGEIPAEITELREWKVRADGSVLHFSYHINLQQELKYESEAWGGATTQMDERMAFINGSLSFMIPLVDNIESPVELSWQAPPGWTVVTPWTVVSDTLQVPSYYALVNNYYVAYKEGSFSRQQVRHLDLNTVWLGTDDINAYPEAGESIRRIVDAGLAFFGEDASKEGITLILRDSNAQNRFRASTEANSIEVNFKRGMTFERIWKDHRDGFLRLLAHEIMHTWDRREVEEASAYLNVREWGPDTCWLREGFTEYFAMLNLYQAGINDLSTFINTMQAISESSRSSNGQGRFSLRSACRVFFEDDVAMNYVYAGGATLAFRLDLELREATGGSKTLPAFMRAYMSEHRYKEKTVESFVSAWKNYAPQALHDLDAWTGSSAPVELTPLLLRLGLEKRTTRGRDVFYWQVPPGSAFSEHY